jgi:hypothetical protein
MAQGCWRRLAGRELVASNASPMCGKKFGRGRRLVLMAQRHRQRADLRGAQNAMGRWAMP